MQNFFLLFFFFYFWVSLFMYFLWRWDVLVWLVLILVWLIKDLRQLSLYDFITIVSSQQHMSRHKIIRVQTVLIIVIAKVIFNQMIFLTWTLMKSEGIYWVQCILILFIFIHSVMAWWIALAFNWATSLTEYFIHGICVLFRSTFVLDDVWVFHINVYLFRLMVLILDKLSFAILSILFYRPILVLMING